MLTLTLRALLDVNFAFVISLKLLFSASQHHQLLGVGIHEAQLAIEPSTVGGHQINALNAHHGRGMKQLVQDAAPKAVTV